jgi:acyl-CoA reductase-like NAD-dependent aldehyde dehydrogenase
VCVFPADGEDDAVALADGVRYGLAASLWTIDVSRRARHPAARGGGRIDQYHDVGRPETAFGGWERSRELGLTGLRE